jgi:hypothetical protein
LSSFLVARRWISGHRQKGTSGIEAIEEGQKILDLTQEPLTQCESFTQHDRHTFSVELGADQGSCAGQILPDLLEDLQILADSALED